MPSMSRIGAALLAASTVVPALDLASAGRVATASRVTTAVVAVGDDLTEALEVAGTLRVIVTFDPANAATSPDTESNDTDGSRLAITAYQDRLERRLLDTGSEVIARHLIVPALTARITRAGLATLRELEGVTGIHRDEATGPADSDGIELIGAERLQIDGYDGRGQTIVVLDTGVQSDHPMFHDGRGGTRVVTEACFSTNDADHTSLCPDGADASTEPGSGVNCDVELTGCHHGTHSAGIAAGGVWESPVGTLSGVATAADIVAIQVFTKRAEPDACAGGAACITTLSSDQLRALEHVQTLAASGMNIAAVNMSLGGGHLSLPCDTNPVSAAIRVLREAGIATIVASGNAGYEGAVAAPACASDAISVGATTNDDLLAWFTNSSRSGLDLLAPGVAVTSAAPHDTVASPSGTSEAAPFVAGGWALLAQADPDADVDRIEAALRVSGVVVSTREPDLELGYAIPRIDLPAALAALDADVLDVRRGGLGRGDVTSEDGLVDCGLTCTIETTPDTTHVLTASPSEGSTFEGWMGCDMVVDDRCHVTVTSLASVTARFRADPPPNDQARTATRLTLGDRLRQDTAGATAGDPIPSCEDSATRAVWFTWTSDRTTQVTLTTRGSDYDTVLTVYRDGSEIACDAGTPAAQGTDSTVTFTAAPAATYTIAVAGSDGESGNLVLSLEGPPVTWPLHIGVSGPGEVVSDPPGLDCGTVCDAQLREGLAIDLVAAPREGAVFLGWSGSCTGTAPRCLIESSEAMYVHARFSGGIYVPIESRRVLDTRTTAPVGSPDGTGDPVVIDLADTAIPDDAVAVTMNVTVVDALDAGFATVYPCGPRPEVSTLNFTTGTTVANEITTALSPDGQVCIHLHGTAGLLVDISGHLDSGYTPLTPRRILDTRTTAPVGSPDGTGDPVVIDLADDDVPSSATAVVVTVTAADPLTPPDGGWMSVAACGQRPTTSNLNFVTAQTVANTMTVTLSSARQICLDVNGRTDVIVDLLGHL